MTGFPPLRQLCLDLIQVACVEGPPLCDGLQNLVPADVACQAPGLAPGLGHADQLVPPHAGDQLEGEALLQPLFPLCPLPLVHVRHVLGVVKGVDETDDGALVRAV
jgi:hypothetical protein